MTPAPRRGPRLAAAALLPLAVSCSRAPGEATPEGGPTPIASSAPAPEPPETAAPEPTPEPTHPFLVKLLDAGQEPRTRLRYAWRAGQREKLSMDLRTAAATEAGGVATPEIVLPPARIVVAIQPTSVSPGGDMTYAWRVTSTSVSAGGPDASALADGMRAEVAAVEHLSGTATVTALGLTADLAIDPGSLPDAAAGASGQMVEQVRQTLRDLAAPFPEESVGRGARWEKVSQLASKDARITQTDTFTLVDVSSRGGALDDVLAQTAPDQPLRTPGGATSQARMESMLASGDARTAFDRSRLVPETRFRGTTTMVLSGATPADGVQRRTMILRVGIDLTGSIEPGGRR